MKKNLPGKHRNVEEIVNEQHLYEVSSDSESLPAEDAGQVADESDQSRDKGEAFNNETPPRSGDREEQSSQSGRGADDNSAENSAATDQQEVNQAQLNLNVQRAEFGDEPKQEAVEVLQKKEKKFRTIDEVIFVQGK